MSKSFATVNHLDIAQFALGLFKPLILLSYKKHKKLKCDIHTG